MSKSKPLFILSILALLLVPMTLVRSGPPNRAARDIAVRGAAEDSAGDSSAALSFLGAKQQEIKEPPDSFDDDAPQLASGLTHILEPHALIIPYKGSAKLNNALMELLAKPELLQIRENPEGSNRGTEVDKYLTYCHVTPPQWWCAAFVAYTIKEAAKQPDVPKSRWSSWLVMCDDIHTFAKKHAMILEKPQVPSVMLIRYSNPAHPEKKFGHTGFVVGYDPDAGTIDTIEGNSNSDGSSNGIGVFRLKRKVTGKLVFIKIV